MCHCWTDHFIDCKKIDNSGKRHGKLMIIHCERNRRLCRGKIDRPTGDRSYDNCKFFINYGMFDRVPPYECHQCGVEKASADFFELARKINRAHAEEKDPTMYDEELKQLKSDQARKRTKRNIEEENAKATAQKAYDEKSEQDVEKEYNGWQNFQRELHVWLQQNGSSPRPTCGNSSGPGCSSTQGDSPEKASDAQ